MKTKYSIKKEGLRLVSETLLNDGAKHFTKKELKALKDINKLKDDSIYESHLIQFFNSHLDVELEFI